MLPAWAGDYSRRLVAATLTLKGETCHLCDLPGADSADHDPPRSVLIRRGVPDPDSLAYLWPAHLWCNKTRGAAPVTPELKRRLRAARESWLTGQRPTTGRPASLSPRFLRD